MSRFALPPGRGRVGGRRNTEAPARSAGATGRPDRFAHVHEALRREMQAIEPDASKQNEAATVTVEPQKRAPRVLRRVEPAPEATNTEPITTERAAPVQPRSTRARPSRAAPVERSAPVEPEKVEPDAAPRRIRGRRRLAQAEARAKAPPPAPVAPPPELPRSEPVKASDRSAEMVGRRIKERRIELRWTLADLGKRLPEPKTKGAVHHWESGLTPMTLRQVQDVARVMDVDPEWLAFGKADPHKTPLVGEIQRGGIVIQLARPEMAPAPPHFGQEPATLDAFRITTDALEPLRVGDLIYVDHEPVPDVEAVLGEEAIVLLESGQHVLRKVEMSPKAGHVNLVDRRGSIMPDVVPVKLWPVVATIRRNAMNRTKSRGTLDAA